jgi:hypothetical protein
VAGGPGHDVCYVDYLDVHSGCEVVVDVT